MVGEDVGDYGGRGQIERAGVPHILAFWEPRSHPFPLEDAKGTWMFGGASRSCHRKPGEEEVREYLHNSVRVGDPQVFLLALSFVPLTI